MKPPVYDFPHRVRGVHSAAREMHKLSQAIRRATSRNDKFALDYLTRRLARAHSVYHALRSREPGLLDQ